MITKLAQPSSPDRAAADRLVIEIAGPAGSGKTTLGELLCHGEEPLIKATIPTSFECLRQLLLRPPLFPMYPPPRTFDRWFTWNEIRSMLYVQAWLRSRPSSPGDLLFDQGPVFRLAILREFGPKTTRETAFDRWRRRVLAAWSETLDLVFWLDAPNAELMRRVRDRAKPHRCKSLGDAEAHVMLDRYRDAHEGVLTAMRNLGNSRIIRIASDKQSPREIARDVRDELERVRGRERQATAAHSWQPAD